MEASVSAPATDADDSGSPQQAFPWHQPKQRKPNGWRDAWHRRLSITWSAIARSLNPSSGIVAMTWTKLDDAFLGDPKLMAAGPLAELVFVRSLVYCNRHLTDGWIPKGALIELCRGLDESASEIPHRLVSEGLWGPAAGGYTVIQFAKYQRLKAVIEKDRAATAARQREYQARLQRHKQHLQDGVEPGCSFCADGLTSTTANGVSNPDTAAARTRRGRRT
jgi:hypothetical protein